MYVSTFHFLDIATQKLDPQPSEAVHAHRAIMDNASLAEQLRPMLKPARGCASKPSHICAAILMAGDAALSSQEACPTRAAAGYLACLLRDTWQEARIYLACPPPLWTLDFGTSLRGLP